MALRCCNDDWSPPVALGSSQVDTPPSASAAGECWATRSGRRNVPRFPRRPSRLARAVHTRAVQPAAVPALAALGGGEGWRRTGGRQRLAAVVGFAGLVVTFPIARAQAESGAGALRAERPRDAGQGHLVIRVVVPPMLTGNRLLDDAFTVTDAGKPLPTTARQLRPDDLQLALAINTGVPADVLLTEQGVARELLLRLPAGALACVINAENGVVLAPPLPRDLAVGLLAKLQPVRAEPQPADRWLVPALDQPVAPSRWRSILYLGEPGPTGSASPSITSRLQAASIPVDELLLHGKPAGSLPAQTGGRLVQAGGADQLLAGADTIGDDLAGSYELLARNPSPGHLRVTVAAAGVGGADIPASSRSVPATRANPAPVGAAPTGSSTGRPRLIVSLLVLLGLVVAAAAVGSGRTRRQT